MTFASYYKDLRKIIPICFFTGACIELFMINTGFYTIVTRKEAERRAEWKALEDGRRQRIASMKLDYNDEDKSSQH
jgi:hypothetical protein